MEGWKVGGGGRGDGGEGQQTVQQVHSLLNHSAITCAVFNYTRHVLSSTHPMIHHYKASLHNLLFINSD